ncbi:MAG: hypothetical protein WCS37_01340 [Chloroflexota bacterium]|nr:sigma-70 family RNA polymerase sigma factor [Chloroflexota bacterium]
MADISEESNLEQKDYWEAIRGDVLQVLVRLRLNHSIYLSIVGETELVLMILDEVRNQYPAKQQVGDRVYRAVCGKIYAACNSAEEVIRELAYQWLGEYLYRTIYPKLNRNRELAEDLTNSTLEIIFKKMATCHHPELFLSWAAQIATREVLQHFRRDSKTKEKATAKLNSALEVVRQQLQFEPTIEIFEPLVMAEGSNPETLFLSRERLRELVARIECLKNTKRASFYKSILYGTYFLGLDDIELSNKLNLSTSEVQKMRFHVLQLLRNDREWLDKIR